MAIWYGYARVSTDYQDNDRQVRDILEFVKKTGTGSPTIITETASGAKDRPELMNLIDKLGKGDILVVSEFSRLTRRGISDLLELAKMITDKEAALVEIKSGQKYDDSAMGQLMLAMTGTFDRLERERISERTKSGLKARKAAGVVLGRPKGKSRLDEQRADINKYQALGLNKTAIAKLLGCSRACYLNWLDKHKS